MRVREGYERTTGVAKEATARERRRTAEVSLRPNMVERLGDARGMG